MVVLSESYVQNLTKNCRSINLNLSPKTYRRYFDETHARFKSKEPSHEFQIGETNFVSIEDVNEEKCLIVLDIKIKNNNGSYEFNVCRKPSLKNVQIKRHSSIPSSAKELRRSVLKNVSGRKQDI